MVYKVLVDYVPSKISKSDSKIIEDTIKAHMKQEAIKEKEYRVQVNLMNRIMNAFMSQKK